MKFSAHNRMAARTLTTHSPHPHRDAADNDRARMQPSVAPQGAGDPPRRVPHPIERSRSARSPEPDPGNGRARPSTQIYSRGQMIFRPGVGRGFVYIVRAGCVRLYKTLPDGRSINVGMLGPNTIFTQEDELEGMSTGATAEAVVPSTLSIIEEHDLADLVATSPELALAVATGMTRRITELQMLIEHLLVRDTSIRLATTLLNLASRFGETEPDGMRVISVPLTHQSLANMIGSNRVTVTRKMLEFQHGGLVRSIARNSLAINETALRALARPDASAPADGVVGDDARGVTHADGRPHA